MKQLGGHTIVMTTEEMQITGAESVEDTAKVLSRYVDAAMFRMSSDEKLRDIAKHAHVPIINGLTNWSHPCQIMADLMTVEEKKGKLDGLHVAWLGDFNNVTRSWAQAAGIFGFTLICAVPPPTPAEKFTNVTFTNDAAQAAKDADVIVTDTWVSMGQEGKAINRFLPYQVNPALMAKAKPDAIFMHCMPIHRGEEVTDDVLNTPASVIYDEAENRLQCAESDLGVVSEGCGGEDLKTERGHTPSSGVCPPVSC